MNKWIKKVNYIIKNLLVRLQSQLDSNQQAFDLFVVDFVGRRELPEQDGLTTCNDEVSARTHCK